VIDGRTKKDDKRKRKTPSKNLGRKEKKKARCLIKERGTHGLARIPG